MKRRDLVRHIEAHQCHERRQGSKHTVYENPCTKKTSTVPRHTEIDDFLAKKICKDLGIPSL